MGNVHIDNGRIILPGHLGHVDVNEEEGNLHCSLKLNYPPVAIGAEDGENRVHLDAGKVKGVDGQCVLRLLRLVHMIQIQYGAVRVLALKSVYLHHIGADGFS